MLTSNSTTKHLQHLHTLHAKTYFNQIKDNTFSMSKHKPFNQSNGNEHA